MKIHGNECVAREEERKKLNKKLMKYSTPRPFPLATLIFLCFVAEYLLVFSRRGKFLRYCSGTSDLSTVYKLSHFVSHKSKLSVLRLHFSLTDLAARCRISAEMRSKKWWKDKGAGVFLNVLHFSGFYMYIYFWKSTAMYYLWDSKQKYFSFLSCTVEPKREREKILVFLRTTSKILFDTLLFLSVALPKNINEMSGSFKTALWFFTAL